MAGKVEQGRGDNRPDWKKKTLNSQNGERWSPKLIRIAHNRPVNETFCGNWGRSQTCLSLDEHAVTLNTHSQWTRTKWLLMREVLQSAWRLQSYQTGKCSVMFHRLTENQNWRSGHANPQMWTRLIFIQSYSCFSVSSSYLSHRYSYQLSILTQLQYGSLHIWLMHVLAFVFVRPSEVSRCECQTSLHWCIFSLLNHKDREGQELYFCTTVDYATTEIYFTLYPVDVSTEQRVSRYTALSF